MPAPDLSRRAPESPRPGSLGSASRLLSRDRLSQLGLLEVVAFGCFLSLPLTTPDIRSLAVDLQDLVIIGLVFVALRWGLRGLADPREQSFWGRLSLAVGIWWLVTLGNQLGGRGYLPWDVAADLGYGAYYFVFLFAVERRPDLPRSSLLRLDARLGWPGVALLVLGAAVYFALVPALAIRSLYLTKLPSMYLFVALDLYLLVRLAHFSLHSPSRRWRRLFAGLAVASGLALVADTSEAMVWAGLLEWSWVSPANLVWSLYPLGLALVARSRHYLPAGSIELDTRDLIAESSHSGAQLVLLAIAFPVVHFLGYGLGAFDPALRETREPVALLWTLILGLLASVQHRLLAARTRLLADHSARTTMELEQAAETLRLATERDQAEEALRKSEEKFSKAFRSSPDAMLVSRVADGTLIEVNDSFMRITGYSRQEVVGRSSLDIGLWVEPSDREQFAARLQDQGTVREFEFPFRTRDGEARAGLLAAEVIDFDGESCVLSVVRDVTETRRSEQALLASERKFASAFHAAPDPSLIVTKAEGRILEVNEVFVRKGGFTREELVGRTGVEVGIQTAEQGAELLTALGDDGLLHELTMVMSTKNGEARTFLLSAAEIELDDQACLLVVGRDITEQQRAQAKIEEQAALLRGASDAIAVLDPEGVITYWNRSAEQLYGWSADEASGRPVGELLFAGTSANLNAAFEAIADHGEWAGELRQIRRDGSPVTVESRWSKVRAPHAESRATLVINTDVTEQRALERQLLRAQRMESIGTLAGGIAHDLNNVLSPILMSVQLLQRTQGPDADTGRLLDTLHANAQRGADMVKQVLTFGRGIEGERAQLQPEQLIQEVAAIVRDTFPKTIDLDIEAPSDLWQVEGDATQLHQVLLNLAVNGRDAMGTGGMLTITADNVDLDAGYCRRHLEARPGAYVRIEVTDTGHGIPTEHLDKIFEPFFTTKVIGEGTGLGLSSVMAIVKSHGGFLSVYSEEGRGSRFSVHLPARPQSASQVAPRVAELPEGRGELILVVDDEAAIRLTTSQTLEAFGYRVVVAEDGARALTTFSRLKGQVHAVLLDMMMPVLDGASTIDAIRRLDSAVPILATSGLSAPAGATDRVQGFLQKPFSAEALLRLLRTTLDAPRSPLHR